VGIAVTEHPRLFPTPAPSVVQPIDARIGGRHTDHAIEGSALPQNAGHRSIARLKRDLIEESARALPLAVRTHSVG
jgi:hypothetical protein